MRFRIILQTEHDITQFVLRMKNYKMHTLRAENYFYATFYALIGNLVPIFKTKFNVINHTHVYQFGLLGHLVVCVRANVFAHNEERKPWLLAT